MFFESGELESYVGPLFDEFGVDGPDGRYLCLGCGTAGWSIADSKARSGNWMLLLEIARAVTAQVVLGLEDIYSGGVVRGGR